MGLSKLTENSRLKKVRRALFAGKEFIWCQKNRSKGPCVVMKEHAPKLKRQKNTTYCSHYTGPLCLRGKLWYKLRASVCSPILALKNALYSSRVQCMFILVYLWYSISVYTAQYQTHTYGWCKYTFLLWKRVFRVSLRGVSHNGHFAHRISSFASPSWEERASYGKAGQSQVGQLWVC